MITNSKKIGDKMQKIIVILAFLVLLMPVIAYYSPLFDANRETICICADKSAGETVILNRLIIHNGRIFPIDGNRRSGCLMLYDYYDAGSAKYREWWQFSPFARFVDSDYDHCCMTGQ